MLKCLEDPRGFSIALAAAALLAVLLHVAALGHGFVGDDHYLIEKNADLDSPGALSRALRPGAWGKAGGRWDRSVNARFYRPVTAAWFVLDANLFGRRAAAFHAVSLATHAAVTLLVGLVLSLLLRARRAAAIGALLFAVHAVHAEPVNMITYRSTLAEALFFLLALLLALKARVATSRGRAIGLVTVGCGVYLLALGSKETAVTLPAVLFLAVLAREGDLPVWARTRAGVLAALPFGVLAGGWLILRHFVTAEPGWTFFTGVEGGTRLYTSLGVLALDLRLLVLPLSFTPFYDWSLVIQTSPWAWDVLGGLAAGLLLLAGPPLLWRRAPRAALLLGVLLVLILPVSNIIPFSVAAGERLLYLPSFAWVGLCALGVETLIGRRRGVLALSVLAIFAAAHATQTVRRTSDWRSDETLLRATVRDYPESVAGQLHLARFLSRGTNAADAAALSKSEACRHYAAAIRLQPALEAARTESARLGCERPR